MISVRFSALFAAGAAALALVPPLAGASGISVGGPIVVGPLAASFDAVETVVAGQGYGVQLTDTTGGAVAWRSWAFDDGATSHAAAPFHTFAADGDHEVCLAVGLASGGSLPTVVSTCRVVTTDRLGYALGRLLGDYADELATPTDLADDYFHAFLDYLPVDFAADHGAELAQLVAGGASTGQVMAWLVDTLGAQYKPFFYVYVGVDLCELFGFPACNVGPVEYVYFDLWDLVGAVDDLVGMQSPLVYGAAGNQDDRDDFVTAYYSQALSAGVSPPAGVGIALVPWPSEAPWHGAPDDDDFDFNSLSGTNPLQWYDNAVTSTIGCGVLFDEDGGLGAETSCGGGISSQMVRLDVSAATLFETTSAGMQCAVDALEAAGDAHGGPIDRLAAMVRTVRLHPLSSDAVRLECGGSETPLMEVRDLSWGPPMRLLIWLAEHSVQIDITSITRDAAGPVTIEGTATFFGNSLLRFDFVARYDFATGGSLRVGRGPLAMEVSGDLALAGDSATLTGAMSWNDHTVGWATIGLGGGGLSAGFDVAVSGASFSLGGFGVTVDVSGHVSLAAGSGGVSATLDGTARAIATVRVGSWSSSFDHTFATGARSFDGDGEATVPVPYPVVQYTTVTTRVPCGTRWCRVCKWGRCASVPCGVRTCTIRRSVPSGLGVGTADVCVDFLDPPYCD